MERRASSGVLSLVSVRGIVVVKKCGVGLVVGSLLCLGPSGVVSVVGARVGLKSLARWVAEVTVLGRRVVKGRITGALLLGESVVGVGTSGFPGAASASDPSISVVVEVMTSDVKSGGGVLHHCDWVGCRWRWDERALQVGVEFAAVRFNGRDAFGNHFGPSLHRPVVHGDGRWGDRFRMGNGGKAVGYGIAD